MKEVFFSEEQLHNLNEVGKELFKDEQDPRSSAYIRKLKRPKISVFKVILFYILFPALVLTALIVVLKYLGLPTTTTVVIGYDLLNGHLPNWNIIKNKNETFKLIHFYSI